VNRRTRLAVLASGSGSNLQALLDAASQPGFPGQVVLVVSDVSTARALERARGAGVSTEVLEPRTFPDRAAFDAALAALLQVRGVEAVCLAGFMRLLGPRFLSAFAGRILNVHPALLPAFPGLHAARQALAAGVKITGCTVHLVDEGVDTGPIVAQAAVPVLPNDDEAALQARIQAEEHRLYPEVVRALCESRIRVEGRRVAVLPPAG
jgi:phosphoribosylglycinamide formyltransferase-1